MSNETYKKALKLGKKSYQASTYNGESGYLLALEDMVSRDDIISEVYLGLVEIPLKKVLGTKTHSRSTAFAKNFMPLLNESTEFALKWEHLSQIHLNEGIRDPIKVYEYLNRYYVLEGNKRVSVLKFYDAVSIPAVVTRVLPRRNEESLQNRLYYEFLPFYECTGINYIWFTREGSFAELMKVIGAEDNWNVEFSQDFKQLYARFRRIYKQVGGENLNITTGDAFLEYIKVYGYKRANSKIDDVLTDQISKIMTELLLLQIKRPIDVVMNPVEVQQKRSIFSSLINKNKTKKIKVAFVYAKSIQESGWTYGHELGRNHIEEVFNDQITTTFVENVPESNSAFKHIKQLVKDGNDVIITTSPTYINPTLKAALEYPHVKFLNCSENMSYRHLRTYYGRIYEAKFLTGIIAGILTKSNVIGYVANYPIAGVISGINSFALGARFVNPNVEIKLVWSRMIKADDIEKAIDEYLLGQGADFVSSEESIKASGENGPFGLYALKNINDQVMRHYMATPIWHWGIFYEKMIKNILDGTWEAVSDAVGAGDKAINYWWGLNAGVVDILYSNSRIPEETKKTIEFIKRMISIEELHPFAGPLRNQEGDLMIAEGDVLSNDAILSMNWLVQGVQGEIPDVLNNEESQPLLDIMGVKKESQ